MECGFISTNSVTVPLMVIGCRTSYAETPWCANVWPPTTRKLATAAIITASLLLIPNLLKGSHSRYSIVFAQIARVHVAALLVLRRYYSLAPNSFLKQVLVLQQAEIRHRNPVRP